MREIEFRAKTIQKGEWVCGYLDHTYDDYTIHSHGDHSCYRVYPETAGQYTGLKDKNGVKIFEGDIVERVIRLITRYDKERFVVNYEDYGFYPFTELIGNTFENCRNCHCRPADECTVIGNIHDNPELLKEADNA